MVRSQVDKANLLTLPKDLKKKNGPYTAILTSSVMIPIVLPSGTGVILIGIVLMMRMRITTLILNVVQVGTGYCLNIV